MLNIGSARWSKPEEIMNVTSYLENINKNNIVSGVPIISNGVSLYVASGEEHAVEIGTTSSGKSRKEFVPYLITCIKSGESIVVHDCKSELYALLKALLNKEGYKVKILNFREPLASNSYWNPLSKPFDYYYHDDKDKARNMIRELAESIMKPYQGDDDPFWSASAASVFSGIAKLLMELGEKSDCTISNIHKCCIDGNEKYISSNYLMELCKLDEFKNTDICYDLSTLNQAALDTRRSILSVLFQGIAIYSSQKGIKDMLSKSDFNFEDITKKKTAIFIIAPDEKTSLNPIISSFIQQLYQVLIDISDTKYSGRLPNRVNIVLDEFSQLPAIEGMSSMLTASRSRNIRFSLGIQSVGQLYDVYGKKANIILENCGLWLYFNSQNIEFLNELSNKLGMYTDYAGENHHLMTVPELMRLDKELGEVLVLYRREHPFITRLPDISKYVLDFSINESYTYRKRMYSASELTFDIQSYVKKELSKKQNELIKAVEKRHSIFNEDGFNGN